MSDTGGEQQIHDSARFGEISASGISTGEIAAFRAAGFTVIEANETTVLSRGFAARLRTPRDLDIEEALALARRIAPGGVIDLSHLYGPSASRAHYAREITGMATGRNCFDGSVIGMIDTQVLPHPFLHRAAIFQRSFVAPGAAGLHGTAVASIIVGDRLGGPKPAGKSRLYAADVFASIGGNLQADAIDLVAALDWLAVSGAKVVNMSLSGPRNALIEAAVTGAASHGMIIVAAAGNGGRNGGPRYPAAYRSVIAVAAIDRRGRPYRYNSSPSEIDIVAPGVDVWAANAGSTGGALWTGTSFAAPYVAVELAAAYRMGLVADAEDAKRYLSANARDLGPPGPDREFGAGLLQAAACG